MIDPTRTPLPRPKHINSGDLISISGLGFFTVIAVDIDGADVLPCSDKGKVSEFDAATGEYRIQFNALLAKQV